MSINPEIERIKQYGVSFRMPSGQYALFTEESAESLIGTITMMNAKEFGYEGEWKVKIVDAKIVDAGRGIDLTFVPVPQ